MVTDDLVIDEHDQLELDRMEQELDSEYEKAKSVPASVEVSPKNDKPEKPNTSIIIDHNKRTSTSDDPDAAPTSVRVPSPQANTGAVRKTSQPIEKYAKKNPVVVLSRSTAERYVQVPTTHAQANKVAAVVRCTTASSTATTATVTATNRVISVSIFPYEYS